MIGIEIRIEVGQDAQNGARGTGTAEHPFPIVRHQCALARRRRHQLNGAEQRGEVDVENAAHSRLHHDVVAKYGNEAAQADADGIYIGHQAEEREATFFIGQRARK